MKNFIILSLLLTTTAHAGIFKARYKGELPKTCEVVFGKEYIETSGSIKGDVAEVLHNAIQYTKKILDLKFESHAYFIANRETYGEYMKYKEIKNDYEAGIIRADRLKTENLDKKDQLINDLAKFEKSIAEKIFRDLSKEREEEIELHADEVARLNKIWSKNQKSYYYALSVWAPYQNNMEVLTNLEKSLMESLKRLSEIDSLSETALKELVTDIRTWRHEEATTTCKTIDEKFQALSQKF